MMTCKACGKEFKKSRRWHIYCSDICRKKGYRIELNAALNSKRIRELLHLQEGIPLIRRFRRQYIMEAIELGYMPEQIITQVKEELIEVYLSAVERGIIEYEFGRKVLEPLLIENLDAKH